MDKEPTPIKSTTPDTVIKFDNGSSISFANKSTFPEMIIEQDGNKVYATMEHKGLKAKVRLSLHFIYLNKDEKFAYLKVNKIAQELLRKVGFKIDANR